MTWGAISIMTSNSPPDNQIVVLVHGIRDFAYWQRELKDTLEENGFTVYPTNYERLDLIRFLFPSFYFRQKAIDKVWRQIEQVISRHPDQKISVIAHSFGTFIVSRLIQTK